MLAVAPRAVEIKSTGSRLSSTSLGSTALKNSTGNAKSSHFNVAASPVGNGLLSLQAHCKSAVALVNERRIEFVRAKNVRVIGHIDGNSKETKPQKQEAKEICSAESVEQLLPWQQSRKIGPGFANLGNTCYLNSVLQCLTYTPCFAQLLLDKDGVAKTTVLSPGNNLYKFNTKIGQNDFNLNVQNGYGFCSVRAMSKLLQLVHGKNTVRVLQPKELVMNVRHISKTFRIGRQEDSHEFFRLLLDSMQRSSLRKARIKNEHHSVASTTFVHRIFGGKLKNCLQCAKCGYISERFDDFLDLSLEVAYGVQSVDSALRHFTATETLDDRNAWKCSKCGQLSRAEKSLSIAECPNVLTIHLKRFDVVSGKITRHIKFPPSLDIATGMSKHCDDRRRGRTKYELHAVLVHAGFSTDCGHYYAFVKGPSGQWYEMNDDSVRWVQIDTVLQQKAYMLFYSRVLPLFEQRKAKETMQKTEKGQVGNEEGKAHVPVSEKVVLQPKELDRTQFLASLKTTLFPNATSIKKTPMTLIVKKSHVTQQASKLMAIKQLQCRDFVVVLVAWVNLI
ncbi:hypothetical protein CCR75_007611 [Bremia lactucae]|uniref:Ubiquitin carboxyl-terminal hydrolase n=1 Tax=Bremia lactucae TaxID=4779 RepID=A0A976ILR6_BRELC|nr:hypothetical protein CCR75_007611 [Bremia lactucae]